MPTDTETLSERCFDANLVVHRVLHIPTTLAVGLNPDLTEWIRTDDGAEVIVTHGLLDEIPGELDAQAVRAALADDDLPHLLSRAHGWLVELSTPIRTDPNPERTSWRLRSGWSTSWWHYAPTYEQAIAAALDWLETKPAAVYRVDG